MRSKLLLVPDFRNKDHVRTDSRQAIVTTICNILPNNSRVGNQQEVVQVRLNYNSLRSFMDYASAQT
jgi:hypothetical protein